MNDYDVLIVGAGFAGSVCAERLAHAGKRILLIDKRPHIAGNAYDEFDDHGVLIHLYGPHIFHTNGKRIFEYLSAFTHWRLYEHRVRAVVDGRHYPIPINRTTINRLYGLELDEAGAVAFLERVREPRSPIRSSEDVVLSSVGRDLCEKFFRGYTKKQWGLDLSELSAGVAARIPTRTDLDDRYFTDSYQFMPAAGYTAMFRRMLAHANIDLRLDTDYFEIRGKVRAQHTVFTGPIDAYYDYCFGKLPYRSLQFRHEHLSQQRQFQEVGTLNYPNEHEFTRITEFKHLTGQSCSGTSIVREIPQSEGEPYYPIPRAENEALYKRYQQLANQDSGVSFVGRLAQYRYYNMDQVVGAALKTADDLVQHANCHIPVVS
jgi:UDP-galactopyranose mutase